MLTPEDFTRYQRQLALPEITPAQQTRLKNARIVVIGAGGLGAPMLPYLAGAGIGHITIFDHDTISLANLHRQTIYKDAQQNQSKAEASAAYLKALNPLIEVTAITQKITAANANLLGGFDLLLDGSDNFATKYLLNEISIATKTPLLTASVEGFRASIGLFAGYFENAPCYACLFPKAPDNCKTCNEAGILGTTAGITGLHQAHMALCYLLEIGTHGIGSILALDFLDLRLQHLKLATDPDCQACAANKTKTTMKANTPMPIDLVPLSKLQNTDHLIVDVRNDYELLQDPIENALHIPLPELATRVNELPRDRMLALVCAGNVRSRTGAEMLQAFGFENVCVLDKFSL
jgi:adenylyltransferase/sulfurtransferase